MPARPRLLDFRSSGGPSAIGLCSTDITSIMAAVNEAMERLINDPLAPDEGWYGSWAKMAFTVSRAEPTIVTPQEVARVILMDVCKHPVRMENEFYEYLQFGPGLHPKGCGSLAEPCGPLTAFERETVVTFEPLLGTAQYVRAYASNPNDVGRHCLIQGKDSNGAVVRFVDAGTGNSGLGEGMTLSSPFTDTAVLWTEITGAQKQKTFGEVEFFQVDPTTGVETPLLVMGPAETTASYRKYYVNGLPQNCCNSCTTTSTTLQVSAMCKLDFVPVTCDSDYLRIMSIPSLIDECMSIRYGRMDTPGAQQLSDKKHASALRILFGQCDHYLGKSNPAIQRHIFGSNRMRMQPI